MPSPPFGSPHDEALQGTRTQAPSHPGWGPSSFHPPERSTAMTTQTRTTRARQFGRSVGTILAQAAAAAVEAEIATKVVVETSPVLLITGVTVTVTRENGWADDPTHTVTLPMVGHGQNASDYAEAAIRDLLFNETINTFHTQKIRVDIPGRLPAYFTARTSLGTTVIRAAR
jgi:hypothetical protein